MKLFFYLAVSVSLMPTTALANENYLCENNGVKRIIQLVYLNDNASVPCEVRYDKGTGMETLWHARTEAGYCEARMNEFITKQHSWGWQCSKFTLPAVSEAADLKPVDDVLDKEQTTLDLSSTP